MLTEQDRVLAGGLLEAINRRTTDAINRLGAGNHVARSHKAADPGAREVVNQVPEDSVTASATDQQRAFVLSVVQPGLAGLMDGSISSLAPLFAAAFATRDSSTAFLVGLATAVGAGISMAFSEGLSDDGKLSGRGNPWVRGGACGLMTFLGAVGHTLPFLIPVFLTAALVAGGVVVVELLVIAWIRNRFMDTPLLAATFQVVVGGVIVFLAGILIGNA
jgi:hypothetical protein